MSSSDHRKEQDALVEYRKNFEQARSFEDDRSFLPLHSDGQPSRTAIPTLMSSSPHGRVAPQSRLSPKATDFKPKWTLGGLPGENAASSGAGSFPGPAGSLPTRRSTMPAIGSLLSGQLEVAESASRSPSPTSLGPTRTAASPDQGRFAGDTDFPQQTTPQTAGTGQQKPKVVNRRLTDRQRPTPPAPWASSSTTPTLVSSPRPMISGEALGRSMSPLSPTNPASSPPGSVEEGYPLHTSPRRQSSAEAHHTTATDP